MNSNIVRSLKIFSSSAHIHHVTAANQGPVSRKSRKFFGPEKPFVKLRPAYSLKLVFLYVVKGMKIKITATFLASRRLRFEDTKRIVTRNAPEKSRDFRETGPKADLFEAGLALNRAKHHCNLEDLILLSLG